MLDKIVLIIAIVTGDELLIDYQIYDNKLSCESTSQYINEYPTNQTMNPRVSSFCVDLNDSDLKDLKDLKDSEYKEI